ncbi:MAG: hypothetical protein IJY23_06695 [Clostridia bacterium]|nr:hypothetical protein [Clostridia bacterium]
MKKALLILLIFTMSLSLISCVGEVEKEVFFSEEALSSLDIKNLPSPKLENSRLDSDGLTLYLNLDKNEYADYVKSVCEYLSGREDVFHFGNLYRSGSFPIFMFLPVPTYEFGYVEEDYDYGSDRHNLVFSSNPELDYNPNNHKYGFLSPVKIEIVYAENSFKEKDGLFSSVFEYNTEITLKSKTQVSFYKDSLCKEKGHTFGEGKINYSKPETVYTCEVCGETKSEPLSDESYVYLDTLLPELSNGAKNSTNVRYKWTPIGVKPGSLAQIYYTSDSTDIEECVSLLSSPLLRINKDEAITEGGSINEYTFFSEDGESYSLTVRNGIIEIGDNAYKYLGKIYVPKNHTLLAYSFVTVSDSYEIYASGEKLGAFDGLSNLEFKEYTGPVALIIPTKYIKCEFGILRIYNDKIFSCEKDGEETRYYELSDGFNFPS